MLIRTAADGLLAMQCLEDRRFSEISGDFSSWEDDDVVVELEKKSTPQDKSSNVIYAFRLAPRSGSVVPRHHVDWLMPRQTMRLNSGLFVDALNLLRKWDSLHQRATESFPSSSLAALLLDGMRLRAKGFMNITGEAVDELPDAESLKPWIKSALDQTVSSVAEFLRQHGKIELALTDEGELNSAFEECILDCLPPLKTTFRSDFLQELVGELAKTVEDKPYASDFGRLVVEDGALKIKVLPREELPSVVDDDEDFRPAEAL